MIEKVKAAIERYGMLEDGERVLVALSGGADSTALLLSLKELGYEVFAVHVNHNLRGEESLRDEAFCVKLCERLDVELYVESVDVKGYCEEKKCSTELGARELRYEALYKRASGCKIATAHTLSDALETLIFNLSRGCGIKGLTSIPPVRGNIVRPLINCTREEIEEYLSEKGQSYVTDSTNLEPDCSRNIIRLNVIPELKKINPGLMKSFAGTLAAIREADRFIELQAWSLISDCKDDEEYLSALLSAEDDAVRSRAIAMILQGEGIEPSFERITTVAELIQTGGRINLKKGVYLRVDEGKLSFEYDKEDEPLNISVTLRENVTFGDKSRSEKEYTSKKLSEKSTTLKKLSEKNSTLKTLVVTKISPFDISSFNKSELRYLIDESKIGGVYTLRHYMGNETIRLPERGFTSTVKKLLSPEERRGNIVIADSEGAIFVEGVGVSERVCCGAETVSAVRIDIIKETEK